MNASQSIKELSAALVEFHRKVGKIRKDSVNPFFKSRYASLSDILDAVEGPLAESGLSVVQLPDGDCLTTMLAHVSGEWISSGQAIRAKQENDPQAVGSAITYARRYALASVLCLNIDEDDDGNAASGKDVARLPQKPPENAHKAQEGSYSIPDGIRTVSVISERRGDTNGVSWQAVSTGDGRALNNSDSPLEPGSTYEVTVVGGKITKATLIPD